MIENVLASRYSCDEINSLFTRKKKYSLEREFWISVLKVQIQFGLKVPTEVVTRYEKIKDDICKSINNSRNNSRINSNKNSPNSSFEEDEDVLELLNDEDGSKKLRVKIFR